MILEFSVGNFLSFKEVQTINMQAAKIKSKYPSIDSNNLIELNQRITLLKSKAIFGANGSGKSNLIKAFLKFTQIIKSSISDNNILNNIQPFALDDDRVDKPTFFQMTFSVNKIIYRYGFEILKGKVINEWLFGIPAKKEVYYFVREGKNIRVNVNKFKEGNKFAQLDKNAPLYRDNSLFLSVVAAFNGQISNTILNYFSSLGISWGLNDKLLTDIATNKMYDEKYRKKIVDLIKGSDMGIEDIEVVEVTSENLTEELKEDFHRLQSKEKKLGVIAVKKRKYKKGKSTGETTFFLHKDEAEGTKKLFSFSPLIFVALEFGSPLIIDEFDARLHPSLCEKIVQLFNSNETNPNNAQLIFATHNSNLLDAKLFRRDQICFVDKNKFGASELYSLAEYKKGIRNDASFEKDYLKGKYGAIPILNDFDSVFLNL